jgi:hypothetical protein
VIQINNVAILTELSLVSPYFSCVFLVFSCFCFPFLLPMNRFSCVCRTRMARYPSPMFFKRFWCARDLYHNSMTIIYYVPFDCLRLWSEMEPSISQHDWIPNLSEHFLQFAFNFHIMTKQIEQKNNTIY